MYYITSKDFKEKVLDQNGLVVVDFSAEWCPPCHMLEPVLRDLEKENAINIYQVNIDDQSDLSRKYKVDKIPCVIFFKDGIEKSRSLGYQSKVYLNKFIEEFK